MANNQIVTVKVKDPRSLGQKETRENLDHWFDQVKSYLKRDDNLRIFLLEETRWDFSRPNYSFQDEGDDSKLKRGPAELKADLEDFLERIAGYLPFRYITQTLKSNTTSWKTVKEAIYDIYGVKSTSSTLLDLHKLKKMPEETYRQFYERMVAHSETHLPLPTREFQFRGITVGLQGEKMTTALYNHIVMDWLRAIDPKLVGLVQIAYSKELKTKDVQLCQLMPDIAENIDELLSRNDTTIQRVTESVLETVSDEAAVRRFREGRGRNRGRGGRGGGRGGGANNIRPCPKCVILQAEMTGTRLDIHHHPEDCPNKRVFVRQVVEVAEEVEQYDDFDEDYEDTGEKSQIREKHSNIIFKVTEKSGNSCEKCEKMKNCQISQASFINTSQGLELSDGETKYLQSRLNRVTDLPTKAESPAFLGERGGNTFVVVADSGAELNCLDKDLADNLGVNYKKTAAKASAAGEMSVSVVGQTKEDFIIQTDFHGEKVNINLQKTVVVDKLGADILLGEPGLGYNGMKTDATHSKIEMTRNGRFYQKPYLKGLKSSYKVCRVNSSQHIYPGESLQWSIPSDLPSDGVYMLAPLREQTEWYRPGVYRARNGSLTLVNTSDQVVRVKKHQHVGEVRLCRSERPETSKVNKIEEVPQCQFKYENFGKEPETSPEPEIDLDPGKTMPMEEKKKFRDITNKFSEVFTKSPGKYNGSFGRVNNTINFASRPPPNKRVYQPQYSEEMKRKQAELMDKLYDFGVLRTPEEIGVSVEVVSPSLIVAKSEPGEYRLVTDFSNINVHIKKCPAVSPIISEAKVMLARKKHFIHVDLSNYFFQSGMTRESCQWLGTVHPYRGTMVYVVEPQGLRNASEHGYEILARVYGDLCQTGAMTRMADSLFVLGDTYTELAENYHEVLSRARKAGLTFKPGKAVICPKTTILFGWQLDGTQWTPTSHTVSALSRAPEPSTVKGMRSFLGSFKQFTECVKDYAHLLHDLDLLCAGRASTEKIVWTEKIRETFQQAKAATSKIEGVHIPRPDDILTTYSDYSEEHKAIGGRMEIKRKDGNKWIKLHGGYFSQVLDSLKSKWLPCEGEALGIKLVLEHFAPFLRENQNISIHYTDNAPCVQAWKRSLMGAFSSSARISQFLTGLSALPVELQHKAGVNMNSSDFISRNPTPCGSPEKCQMCRFARKLQTEGENTRKIRAVTVKDVLNGETLMPYTQRRSWLGVQRMDGVHNQLTKLIESSQLPDKRKTRGDATKLKQLHTLYSKGDLKIDNDGLIMVKHSQGHYGGWTISIPYQLMPGLANALHITLQHPSRAQLAALMARYFYCPGHTSIIHEVTDGCGVCRSLQRLPKAVLENTTEIVESLGSEFAIDVMERFSQKIFLAREKLSQFTWLQLIPDQTKETLRSAILQNILPWVNRSGATIRCDGATALASLAAEAEMEDSIFSKNKIKIDIGRLHNKNKNPVAENAIQECEKEILRHKHHTRVLTQDDLAAVQRSMNDRIRNRGLAAKEILLRRDLVSHEPKDIQDKQLSNQQAENRLAVTNRDKEPDPLNQNHEYHVGDLVYLVDQLSKHQPRETFIITGFLHDSIEIQKLHTQFRQKKYRVFPAELTPAVSNNTELFQKYNSRKNDETNDQENTEDLPENEKKDKMIVKKGRKKKSQISQPPLTSRPTRGAAREAKKRIEALSLMKVNHQLEEWRKPKSGRSDEVSDDDDDDDQFQNVIKDDGHEELQDENEDNHGDHQDGAIGGVDADQEEDEKPNPFLLLADPQDTDDTERISPVPAPHLLSSVQLGTRAPVQELTAVLDSINITARPTRERQVEHYGHFAKTGEKTLKRK